jgi:hypothetical protein
MTAGAPGLPGTSLNARSCGVTGSQSSVPAKHNTDDPKQIDNRKYRTHRIAFTPKYKGPMLSDNTWIFVEIVCWTRLIQARRGLPG